MCARKVRVMVDLRGADCVFSFPALITDFTARDLLLAFPTPADLNEFLVEKNVRSVARRMDIRLAIVKAFVREGEELTQEERDTERDRERGRNVTEARARASANGGQSMAASKKKRKRKTAPEEPGVAAREKPSAPLKQSESKGHFLCMPFLRILQINNVTI